MADPIELFKKSRIKGHTRSGHPVYYGKSDSEYFSDPSISMHTNGQDTTYSYDPGRFKFIPIPRNLDASNTDLMQSNYKKLQQIYNNAAKNAGPEYKPFNRK